MEQIHRSSIKDAERVLAAVAYVTQDRPFLDLCWKEKKPLTLYARHDYTGPVNPSVFDWFFSKSLQSANYEIRLVRDIFHTKIIWWKRVGAYIGSANLTNAAWFKSYEAGLFVKEEESIAAGFYDDLEDFFDEIHQASQTVTKEIADQIKEMIAKGFGPIDYKLEQEFKKSCPIKELPSLISITPVPSKDRKKAEFLEEWNHTLEHIRNISERLALDENRPVWIPKGTPKGVLADQFLHAFYYNKVKIGIYSHVDDFYARNKADREAALTDAINWWRKLPSAPSNELDHITNWAPEVCRRLNAGQVGGISEDDFVEVCSRIHAMLDHASKMDASDFGIKQQLPTMTKKDRIVLFGKWLYQQKSHNNLSAANLINFVLYGGSKSEISQRLFTACYDQEYKIPHLGVSMLGEMIGWALPNDFPPRNGRTSKGLKALGYNVKIHS
ncbi:MAG: phospholipase D-like domain-containing protein [Chlamydiia bacterium]